MYYNLLKKIGLAHQCSKDYDKAKNYLSQSLEIVQSKYKGKHRSRAIIYRDFANFYLEQDSLLQALDLYQKGIVSLVYDFEDTTNIYKNPNLNKILAENVLLQLFDKKAEALERLYEKEKEDKMLLTALECYEKADSVIAKIRQGLQTEGSKQFLSENALPIYESAIGTTLKLYELTSDIKYQYMAFEFAEKNKALLLMEALQDSEAKDKYLPDSLLEKETDLKVEIAYIEKKLYKEQNKGDKTDSLKVREYQNTLFDLNRNFEAFQEKIEKEYPDYFNLKYNLYTPTVEDIQAKLADQSAMLEYFVGDSLFYTFAISKEGLKVFEMEKPDDFHSTIQDYRKALTDYRFFLDSTAVAQRMYFDRAGKIYDWTLKDVYNTFENKTQLIIIPDDALNFVNFETLVKDKNGQFNDLNNFVIQDYAISYAYSASHLFDFKKEGTKKTTEKLAYGGFAPTYGTDGLMAENEEEKEEAAILDFKTRGGYVDLPEARNAVKKIAGLLDGKQWLAQEATEENFKKNAADYDILHLAMHGVTDNQNPLYSKLIFTQTTDTLQDDYLNAYELYNMKLGADLTVLSACNTGFGEFKKGEGVMSLARAFAYAGCPSLVMSLWSVPSEETANIMYDFYDNLHKGTDKASALREAKIHYLENAMPERKHPFFWAGFIPIGDTTPIFVSPTNWFFIINCLIGGLFLLGISIFILKNKKTS